MSKYVGNQLRKFYSHLSTKKRLKAVRADLKRARRNAVHCQAVGGPYQIDRHCCLGAAFPWQYTPEGSEYWSARDVEA